MKEYARYQSRLVAGCNLQIAQALYCTLHVSPMLHCSFLSQSGRVAEGCMGFCYYHAAVYYADDFALLRKFILGGPIIWTLQLHPQKAASSLHKADGSLAPRNGRRTRTGYVQCAGTSIVITNCLLPSDAPEPGKGREGLALRCHKPARGHRTAGRCALELASYRPSLLRSAGFGGENIARVQGATSEA